jgi:outer membrane protein
MIAARGWIVSGLLLGLASIAEAQEIHRIGVVDVDRVLAQSVAGRNARQDLERARTQAQTEVTTRGAAIEKLREDLRRTGALLSPDARRAKEAELERVTREAARTAEDLQRELERKNATLVQAALREIDEIVTRFGREKGYYLLQQVGQKPGARPKTP